MSLIILTMTIVGFPLAMFLAAAPFLFLLAAGIRVCGVVFGGTAKAHLAGVGVTLAVLAAPSLHGNYLLDALARQLIEGDHDEGTKPSTRILAIRKGPYSASGGVASGCDGLCQRALINGVTNQFLIFDQPVTQAFEVGMMVKAFRMERRSACPDTPYANNDDPIKIPDEANGWKGKRIDELMKIEIAKGNCLISEMVPLGSADTVISVGSTHQGVHKNKAGFSIFADTLSAHSISMHERRGREYVETYRSTGVYAKRLAPFLIPFIEEPIALQVSPAFLRFSESINMSGGEYGGTDWGGFLVGRLGLDLRKRSGAAQAETRRLIGEWISLGLEKSAQGSELAIDFFEGIQRSNAMTNEDIELAHQLLTDHRFRVPYNAASAIWNAKDAPQRYFESVGKSMFARLRDMVGVNLAQPHNKWLGDAGSVANVISSLPRSVVLQHRSDLEWLARQERARVPAYSALIRLSEFGAEAAPTLMYLIVDSNRFFELDPDPFGDHNTWQHPYLAGLIGLCRIGEPASAMIEEIYGHLGSGLMVKRGSYWDLTINTLIGLGADPDEVWSHLQTSDTNHTRERFDREVRRALRERDCSY
jgi:hypothetical protein